MTTRQAPLWAWARATADPQAAEDSIRRLMRPKCGQESAQQLSSHAQPADVRAAARCWHCSALSTLFGQHRLPLSSLARASPTGDSPRPAEAKLQTSREGADHEIHSHLPSTVSHLSISPSTKLVVVSSASTYLVVSLCQSPATPSAIFSSRFDYNRKPESVLHVSSRQVVYKLPRIAGTQASRGQGGMPVAAE